MRKQTPIQRVAAFATQSEMHFHSKAADSPTTLVAHTEDLNETGFSLQRRFQTLSRMINPSDFGDELNSLVKLIRDARTKLNAETPDIANQIKSGNINRQEGILGLIEMNISAC